MTLSNGPCIRITLWVFFAFNFYSVIYLLNWSKFWFQIRCFLTFVSRIQNPYPDPDPNLYFSAWSGSGHSPPGSATLLNRSIQVFHISSDFFPGYHTSQVIVVWWNMPILKWDIDSEWDKAKYSEQETEIKGKRDKKE